MGSEGKEKEKSKEEEIPTLEQAIDQIREGMKKPILEQIKNELIQLQTEHHVEKIPDLEYAKREKELLDAQEKIKNDKVKVTSLAIMVQFEDRGPAHYYAGALKMGDQVLPGATSPELYNMVNTVKFMIENQTVDGIVHGQLIGMSMDLKKSLSAFLRSFIQQNQSAMLMDRSFPPGGRK